jgi:DNA-binding CsgD family transcriptional regulator/tetratricopeptide (TPR) repeat protein
VPTVPPAGALFGRDTEMAMLVGLIARAGASQGSAVLIEGEPGIGKSSLVRAALAAGAAAGCQVFWGAGDELGQALSLLPVLDGLRVREPSANRRRATIVRILHGEVSAGCGLDASAVLAEQLLALVTELCEERPTILVIDDLQWADQATVTFWARLARSAPQVPLLLIGMMRPVPQREDLLALRRAVHSSARLQLTGLAQEPVANLVGALAGARPGDGLLRLAGGAAGNPLYVTELMGALARSSGLRISSAGTAELVDGCTPASLPAAIADRLGFVSVQVREVLRAAALLGVDFAVRDLAIVLGRAVADLIPAIDEAVAAGVLTESGHGLGFRHPLIRAALYDEMPKAVRAAWHRDAGRALADDGAPADRVARQLLQAVGDGSGDAGASVDEWILTWLAGASELIVDRAPQVAADLLRQAVADYPAGSAQQTRLATRLAEALYRVGDAAEAEQVASRALVHASEPDLVVDLHWTLAQCRMRIGRFAESLATLNEALAAPGITARHRARLLVLAARTHSILGEVEKAGRFAETALGMASEAADGWAVAWALHVLTIVAGVQGQMAEALPLFERALAVTEADPLLTDLRLLLQINMAIVLSNLDRHDEALGAAMQARDLADQVGTVNRLAQAHSALGQLLFDTGQWDDALTEVQVLQADLKEPAAACSDLGIAAMISFHRGEVTAARNHLAVATDCAKRTGYRVVPSLALARSLACERDGALLEALAALTAGFTDDLEEHSEIEDVVADTVRLAAQIGDLTLAKMFAGHAAALASGSTIPRRQANNLYCGGMLERDAAQLIEAAARYAEAGRPLLRAKALEAAAGLLVTSDERSQARHAFTRAVEIYGSLGATADVGRLQAHFRAHGIRRGPRAKHRQKQTGWDSLTPTEVKVAALVEEGLSNPQIAAKLFTSRRTVATHVSHILKKLDVHSRIDIARESARRAVTST